MFDGYSTLPEAVGKGRVRWRSARMAAHDSSWTKCLRSGVRAMMLGVGEGERTVTRVLLERL